MRITLKQLQVFVNTAKSESISAGAEKCFISQAAASMSLSQLENMLDTTLFDRVGKRMKLNANGKNLLAKAIKILDEIEEFETFSVKNTLLSGKIVIGASTTIANYVLPKYVAIFKKLHPDTDFEIISGNTKEIINNVESLNCDVGFIEGECNSQVIATSLWAKDKLKIICRVNHPLTTKNNLKIKDLLEYEWATREQGSGTFEIFFNALEDKVSSIKKAITLRSSEAIKQYVAYSDCLACISEVITTQALDTTKYSILETKDLDLSRNFYKLLHKKKYHTALTQAFCDFIEKDINGCDIRLENFSI
ncbi:LysR family transcriptional regulator [Francisella tularensis subsp. novicida]|uniref:LysR family transcriptional regulator n=2 Tax=Francisella tularensis TaxID=263 RepID=A0A6I4RST6_FRATU|nr:LysR substrate-binding domain-containing protein [Francisella tularensis]ABK89295.1 transcriptional regulator, LysR family [Francisella tularensis subsp. novicida U112]AJI46226.1 bacterial regulatory helix-turn-helix, lysR family protein [Francisella tularensis subsp. novicida F6168]AJI61697.1 bacterial regulatory helix-turn-helix, lysR family protein [Francisella tularensis subsp. novicida U112]AJI73461.1 bacterial regulatory helix-turn-helix, lysR family protein [Francisella tularensis sub